MIVSLPSLLVIMVFFFREPAKSIELIQSLKESNVYSLTVCDHRRRRGHPIRPGSSKCHVHRATGVPRPPSLPEYQHIWTPTAAYPLESIINSNLKIYIQRNRANYLQSDNPRFSSKMSPMSPSKTAISEKNTSLAHQWPPVP